MPSVYRQKNNIVPAIRGCAKSAAPDVLYAARIDVYKRMPPNRAAFRSNSMRQYFLEVLLLNSFDLIS